MSIRKVGVDDNSGSVVYSGAWSLIQNSNAFDGTLHRASGVGAYASLTFTGTSINIVGSLPACVNPTSSGYWVTMKLANDTGTTARIVESKQITCTSPAQYGITLFSSGTLTNEARIVMVQSIMDTPLDIDLFAYVSDSTGQVSVVSPASSASPAISSLASAKTSSSPSSTGTTTTGSSSSTSRADSAKSDSKTLSGTGNAGLFTAFETVMVLTTINGIATSIPVVTSPSSTPGPNVSDNSDSGGSSKPSIGPIIGGVVAAILIVIILAFLLLRCRRRTRRGKFTVGGSAVETVDPFRALPSSTFGSMANSPHTPSFFPNSPFFDPPLLSPYLDRPQSGGNTGTVGASSTSLNDPFSASATLDRKEPLDVHDSEPQFSTPTYPPQPEPTIYSSASSSGASSFPQPVRYSFLNRPPSSIAPSEVAPAYTQHLNNRPQYRSGLSTFTSPRLSVSQTLDIPPSYESVGTAAVPVAPP